MKRNRLLTTGCLLLEDRFMLDAAAEDAAGDTATEGESAPVSTPSDRGEENDSTTSRGVAGESTPRSDDEADDRRRRGRRERVESTSPSDETGQAAPAVAEENEAAPPRGATDESTSPSDEADDAAPALNEENEAAATAQPSDAPRSVEFPDEFIRDPNNGTIPASTVEALDADGNPLTGEGVTVGIISDSFNTLGGAEADIASGDLPANFQIAGESPTTQTDEGRAIAQVVNDVAPDAQLIGQSFFFNPDLSSDDPDSPADPELDEILSTNPSSFQDFLIGRTVDSLASNPDVDIIVDDVQSAESPVFQRGFEDRAQDAAINRPEEDGGPITVIQSAGNFANASVEVPFTGEPGDFVDFDPDTPGIQGIPRTFSSGEFVQATLHHDDPFPSLSPDAEVTADFDFFFVPNEAIAGNADLNEVVDEQRSSESSVNGIEGPFFAGTRGQLTDEGIATGTNPVETISGNVSEDVPQVSGQFQAQFVGGDGDDRLVRASFFDFGATDSEAVAEDARIAGEDLAFANRTLAENSVFEETGDEAAAIAAGEAAFQETIDTFPSVNLDGPTLQSTTNGVINVGAVNATTDQLQPFSSRGGNRILFDDDGRRLSASELEEQDEVVVDVLGPDGANTTFFGQDSPLDPDDNPNFFGTSAASPAVAGVAALLLQDNPDLTPAQVEALLREGADGRNDDGSFGPDGTNDFTGAGLISATGSAEFGQNVPLEELV